MKSHSKATPLFLAVFLAHTALASDLTNELNIRDLSLGGINIATASPLSVAGQGSLTTGLFVDYPNKFSMKELATGSFSGLLHSSFMTHVVRVASAGYEDYRQTSLYLHAQKNLSERLSLGVVLRSTSVSAITLENNLWEISPHLGFEYTLSRSLTFGMNFLNLVRAGSKEHLALQTRFKIATGIAYRPSEQFLLAVGYEWEDYNKSRIRFGIECAVIEAWKIRAGVSSYPFSPAFGLGYGYRRWIVDISSERHPHLGNSLSIGLSYLFKE